MKYISDISTTRPPWLLLTLTALFLEISALFFQYGLELKPCILCIYQRLAIWAIFFAGLIGSVYYQHIWARLIAYLTWAVGAIWGGIIALEHYEAETNSNPFFASCEFVPNFPSWAPLHDWLPLLFAAEGDCSNLDWQFLGFSMPQVMMLTFALYTVALVVVLASRLYHQRKL